jgi:predicted porin
MFAVGYVYSLSKRTSVYTNYARINNGGNAAAGGRFTASTTGPMPAKYAGGQTSSGYEFGIRHDF